MQFHYFMTNWGCRHKRLSRSKFLQHGRNFYRAEEMFKSRIRSIQQLVLSLLLLLLFALCCTDRTEIYRNSLTACMIRFTKLSKTLFNWYAFIEQNAALQSKFGSELFVSPCISGLVLYARDACKNTKGLCLLRLGYSISSHQQPEWLLSCCTTAQRLGLKY